MSFKNGEGLGVDIKTIGEMLGHTNVSITMKIYHHINANAVGEMYRNYGPLLNTNITLPD